MGVLCHCKYWSLLVVGRACRRQVLTPAAHYAVTRATVTKGVQAAHHYSLPGTPGLYVLHTHAAHGIRSARLEAFRP